MRRVLTMQPGVAGMNRDVEGYLVERNQSVFAQDALARDLMLRRIRGWEYDGSVEDVIGALNSVWRAHFALADRRMTVTTQTSVYRHNDAAPATLIGAGRSGALLARCFYRDELILCAQDGVGGIVRYAGSLIGANSNSPDGTGGFSANEATIGFSNGWDVVPDVGSFVQVRQLADTAIQLANISFKVLNVGTNEVTVEDVYASATKNISSGGHNYGWGNAYPAVAVYEAGTVTVSTLIATGIGTKWSDLPTLFNEGYSFLIKPPGADARHGALITSMPTDDDTASVYLPNQATPVPYAITSGCPFKDAAAHRGSLFGTGCVAHPNRVYASPQGWNPSLPPGFVPPFDPAIGTISDNPNDFLLFEIDVPTPFDGDPNVALLSAPQGLWVLKRKSAHMVYGDYPTFRQGMIGDGFGCIDIRSAWSFGGIRVWAGEEGVWGDYGEHEPRNLTERRQGTGGINNDWRAMMAGFDHDGSDTCTIGEAHGTLLVSLTSGGGTDHVCWSHDLRTGAWVSEFTRHKASFFFSSKLPGEPERLLWVGPERPGRVIDSAGAIAGTSSAFNGDGTKPHFKYHSPAALGEVAGIEGEATIGDIAIHANVLDVSGSPFSNLNVTVEHAGGLRQAGLETKTLEAIPADDTDRVDRHDRRVNRSGRLLQIKVEAPNIATNDTTSTVELAAIVLDLFDAAAGT